MDKFQPDELFPDGIAARTYSDILGALRKDLILVHEFTCASADLLNALGRHAGGDVGEAISKGGEVNFSMMVALEGMLSSLAAVEKHEDTILLATLQAYPRVRGKRPWKKTVLWFGIGAMTALGTVAASWVGGLKTGSLVGYSRAFEDLAAGGMIEMKRHGDWVDLTMGPSNPVGQNDPTKRNATLRLDADKVPELR